MAAVATATRRQESDKNWMVWTLWAAGIGLLLVEVNAGMEYLEAGLRQNVGNLLGWLPAMGVITLKAAEQAVWHWGTLALVLRAVPLAAMGLILVAISVSMQK
ncbi:MAG TPA: hypothetical protein VMU53_08235 [Candidatus Sulfotelmatobacter sp.]|nr:hypothetical protein [Candidatus Sulfotelmatobacter sp.]